LTHASDLWNSEIYGDKVVTGNPATKPEGINLRAFLYVGCR